MSLAHRSRQLHRSQFLVMVQDGSNPVSIYTGARINIIRNVAERGGGLSLEANARVYILKYDYFYFNTTTFTANSADYSGAIHVDDETNSGTCANNIETECFFQVLALHDAKAPSTSHNTEYALLTKPC